ncbi:hypothetical protein KFU94_71335 [Chloroflexi bacterium TSY]|nr:hypothetical protein [Chloroflexi bacterium TSY]
MQSQNRSFPQLAIDFRYFTQQFARCSRKESSWAAFTAARQRGLKRVMLIALSLIAGFASFGNCGRQETL